MVTQDQNLSDLRNMVSEIANNVGLDTSNLLQDELDALGRRLTDVKDSITTLADVADNQAINRHEIDDTIVQARTYLNNVQQVNYFIIIIILNCV